MKIKVSTIARVIALLVSITNQMLAIFGKNLLPFTDEAAYQIVSAIITTAVVFYTAWKNNDITFFARVAGSLFSALKDGKITAEEVIDFINTTGKKED